MIPQIKKFFDDCCARDRRIAKNKEEVNENRPNPSAIIKLSNNAKENALFDDENKIIDIVDGDRRKTISYTEADVFALRDQGIPVDEEDYSDEFKFIEADIGGSLERRR